MRKKFLLGSSTFLLSLNLSLALFGAQVSPTPQTDVDHSGTATGSSVEVLADGSSVAGYRVDCFLQNNGTNVMYYFFGSAGSTATTSSKRLTPGAIMNCNDGVTVSSQALELLGTTGDTYSLTESFSRGQ